MDPLLDDVLLGTDALELREATLKLSMELARRRRRSRARNRVALAIMLPLAAALVGMNWPRRQAAPPIASSFAVVHTTPLRPGVRVETRGVSDVVIRAEPARYAVVRTDPANPGYRTLSDQALLAMFPNRPVGLIADPQGRRHLIFLDGGEVTSPGE
jgi:hypothetical protein